MSEPNSNVVSHFWIPSSPFMEGSLMLSSPISQETSGEVVVEIFDPDGAAVNRLSVGSPARGPVFLELDPLMEGCKFESGMRHAHLIVTAHSSVRAMCRFHNRGGATLAAPLTTVTPDRAVFSPVALGPKQSGLVVMVNFSLQEAAVRCRLMLANRSPDVVINVPGNGARIVCLEKEFREPILSGFGKRRSGEGEELEELIPEMRAYIRVSPRSDQSIGVQYIEGFERSDIGMVFTATGA